MNIINSRRESDDGYASVVARLNARWRVIQCRNAIQWILQRVNQVRDRRTEWKGVSYCRTRNAIIRVSCRSVDDLAPSALATLRALPEHIEEGRP